MEKVFWQVYVYGIDAGGGIVPFGSFTNFGGCVNDPNTAVCIRGFTRAPSAEVIVVVYDVYFKTVPVVSGNGLYRLRFAVKDSEGMMLEEHQPEMAAPGGLARPSWVNQWVRGWGFDRPRPFLWPW